MDFLFSASLLRITSLAFYASECWVSFCVHVPGVLQWASSLLNIHINNHVLSIMRACCGVSALVFFVPHLRFRFVMC